MSRKVRVYEAILGLLVVSVAALAQPAIHWSYTTGLEDRHDECYFIQALDNGGCICAGQTQDRGSAESTWLREFSAEGEELWEQVYGWGDNRRCYTGLQTSDGTYLLAGGCYSSEHAENMWALRLDAHYDTLWNYEYEVPGGYYQFCKSVCETPDGGFLLCGTDIVSPTLYHSRVLLIKLNAQGRFEWQREYEGEWEGDGWQGWYVQVLSSGDYLIVGLRRFPVPSENNNLYGYRVQPTGELVWQRGYSNAAFGPHAGVNGKRTADGGCIIAGLHYLLRLDAEGDSVWLKQFGYVPLQVLTAAEELPDGGFIAVGSTRPTTSDRSDGILVRTDADGNMLWSQSYGDSTNEGFLAVTRSSDNCYLVGGWGGSLGTYGHYYYDPDIWVLKTTVDTTLPPPNRIGPSPVPASPLLLNAFPNPFNSATEIQYTLPHAAHVSLTIHDVLGRAIATVQDEMMTAGEHRVIWLAEGLPSGLYFARLAAGPETRTQKLALVR